MVAVAGQYLTFVPAQPLPPGQTVSVTLAAGVRDVDGRAVGPAAGPWVFVTGSGPAPLSGFVFTAPLLAPMDSHVLDRAIAVDGESGVVAWTTPNQLLVAETPDGLSFHPPATLTDQGWNDEVSLAVAGGVAHVAWSDFSPGPGFVYYARAGLSPSPSVSPPVLLSAVPGATAYVPQVAAGPDGTVVVVWSLEQDLCSSIFFTDVGPHAVVSKDGGMTFSPPVNLDPAGGEHPAVALVGGAIVAAWTGDWGGQWELRIVTSNDHGATFSPPAIAVTAGAPMGPVQIVDDHAGHALVTWPQGNGPQATYILRVDPAMGPIGSPYAIDMPDAAFDSSVMASNPGGAVLFSRSADDGTTLSLSTDGGQTFGPRLSTPVQPVMRAIMAYTAAGDAYMAWNVAPMDLVVSRARPARPCEQ
jgi:hypothetical protein